MFIDQDELKKDDEMKIKEKIVLGFYVFPKISNMCVAHDIGFYIPHMTLGFIFLLFWIALHILTQNGSENGFMRILTILFILCILWRMKMVEWELYFDSLFSFSVSTKLKKTPSFHYFVSIPPYQTHVWHAS